MCIGSWRSPVGRPRLERHPPSEAGIPVVSSNQFDCLTSSSEVDATVGTHVRSTFTPDVFNNRRFAALQPDLNHKQAFYEVCAISTMVAQDMLDDIPEMVIHERLPQPVSLEAKIFHDIVSLIGPVDERHPSTTDLVADLRARIERLQAQLEGVTPRRVAFFTWIDPLYAPGHWILELVTMVARRPCLGMGGAPSCRISWGDVIAFAPEVIILSPSGLSLEETLNEAQDILPNRTAWQALPAVRSGHVYAIDGIRYFSRPSPRIVDSLELVAELVHPDRCCGWGPKGAAQRLDFNDAEER
jgi:iron complex transport system substrate-binding protein